MASFGNRQVKLFHIAEELSNLIWLGLSTVVLQVERTGCLRVLYRGISAWPERVWVGRNGVSVPPDGFWQLHRGVSV
jgi:hypothetical protein